MVNSMPPSGNSRQLSIAVMYAAFGKRRNISRAFSRAASRGNENVSRRYESRARALQLRAATRHAAGDIPGAAITHTRAPTAASYDKFGHRCRILHRRPAASAASMH